ncbi:unnamed protein product [Closterium sp. NIES-54]
MVTIPPLPSLATDGRQVRISLRPAFPRARGIGRANIPPHCASCPTVLVGTESVTLPSVSRPAAHAAPASEVPRATFLRVSAVDQPCAIPHPPSLCTAPSAVAALLTCVCAWLLLLRVIPAPAVRACLPLGSGAPAATRRLPDVLLDVWDLPRVTPAPPHPLPLPPPHTSQPFHWSARNLPLCLCPAHPGSRPPVRGRARAPRPCPQLCPSSSVRARPSRPSSFSTTASALVTELVDFAAACPLEYATSLVAASASVCPLSVAGECALGTNVLEDRQEDFECFAASVPHLMSMLTALEEDPDAPDIPTPCSYAEAIEGPYSSQWQAAKDAEMASWKSTRTYVDEVPPPGANIAPREWHDTLRTTLATLGFAPSTVDPSLFLRTDTTLPPFYVLVYVDDLFFATADTEALAHMKSELQKRHTCTDLGELTSYLGLRITRDRAQCTITLTQSHMVQQVLQRFGFTYSSPQSTPLPTGHSLSAPPSDESVELSGLYPELVGCLMYLMTCTRPDLAYPLSLLAHYVAPGRHQKVHWDAAKRVLRYLCSTSGMGLVLGGRARAVLTGHADTSWVDDLATQRSSQGYTFSLGSGSVSWRSTRSSSVLSSSCEAEIYAGAMAAQDLRWLTYLLTDLGEAPAACRLNYATALVAESNSACPPSVGGECALGTDVLEDRQEDFECLAAAVPRFTSMLIAPEGDPDAPDIPTPRSYAEAITGPYSSQWQAAMDAEMASWKSTSTHVDEVPPIGANIVDGMWILRVKQPPDSPSAFKVHYVARGFSKQQGGDYFQTFSPTPKMTTLRVLLHVASQRNYELHSLDFSTAFLCPVEPPVSSLQSREWHDTLRTTLTALGFAPSTTDPSLFLCTDTCLQPFYVRVYIDNFVFATAHTEALTLVKSEVQKRHTCTDLGELCSYLGLQITRDRAQRTITLTHSHMVHQVLQRFGFKFSSPQPTPLSTGHSLSAPPPDKSVEPRGPYPKLVGCLITLGMGLLLGGRGSVVLTGHADASWAYDLATQRSSQGYTFSLGSGSVSWRSTRLSSVLSSSCEAEIYAGAMAAQELR